MESAAFGTENRSPGPASVRADLESSPPEPDHEKPASADAGSRPSELLDAFLAGEIPAVNDGGGSAFMISDLTFDEEDYFSHSVGGRADLDNDGEKEQILNGPYGGIYLDARDGAVHVLACGEGTAGVLFYTVYEQAFWIVHCDTTHAGRQVYWLEKYDGGGNIVDGFVLSAEYWSSPDDRYDENSDFSCGDEKITMAEFEALREEILEKAVFTAGAS